MKIYNFKCDTFTPFAPHWNYYVGEKVSKVDFFDLKEEILNKEQEIISKYEYENDWGTGLGKRSLTARSNRYNLLEFNNAEGLREEIRSLHDEFLKGLGYEYTGKIYVQCWANVMRKNQKIKVHCHGFGPYSHLSGHLCVQVNEDLYPTSTHYYNPYGVEPWSSPNNNNKMTIFPTWLKHGTDRHIDDVERITIAFDIMDDRGYNIDVKDDMKSHWVEL
tara:strand:+ start:185 stop:841 length:657 start_codon:yes stop_codon:yes gene_type:complete